MKSVLLSVNLLGVIKGQEKHTTAQVVTVDVTPLGNKIPEFMTKKIKHNDRNSTECCRKMKINEEMVNNMENGECPHWEKPSQWKTMSKHQKLVSHLKRYDEGFGIKFDIIEN